MPLYGPHNALSTGKETPKFPLSPWDCITPPEEDRGTALGNMHKKLVKIVRVVREICSRTDRRTHRRAHYNTSPQLPQAK